MQLIRLLAESKVAVGPLGRNAEGSGALNTKGKVAAMYSYSKTKGLFGGVSVEGSVILERQDANRLAYGSSVSSKQLLSGDVEPPEWAYCLTHELDKCTGLPGGQKWREEDEDGEGGGMGWDTPPYENNSKASGGRSRGSSLGQGYVFGDGIGPGGRNSPSSPGQGSGSGAGAAQEKTGRRRAGTLLDAVTPGSRERDRPTSKRASSFIPFSGGNSSSPKKGAAINSPSSENYNAGLTWDSDGPMKAYATRPRSGSTPLRQSQSQSGSPFVNPSAEFANNDTDHLDPNPDLADGYGAGSSSRRDRNRRAEERDLLPAWSSNGNGNGDKLTESFATMHLDGGATSGVTGGRSRSNSKTIRGKTFEEIPERWDDDGDDALGGRQRNGVQKSKSPFDDDIAALESNITQLRSKLSRAGVEHTSPGRSGAGSGSHPGSRRSTSHDYGVSSTSSRPGSSSSGARLGRYENYPRAMALYDFPAAAPGDLSLKKGQVVVVLDKVGSGGEWWKGVLLAKDEFGLGSGQEGIFPSNYVEVVEMPRDFRGGVGRSELRSRMMGREFD